MRPVACRYQAGLALALLGACNGGGTEGPDFEDVALEGTWRGGFSSEEAFMSAVFNLTAQDTVLGGGGYISGSGIECEVTIDGRLRGERILLDISCLDFPTIRFRGKRVAATRIDGTVAGSGIPPSSMRLTRQ